MASGLHPCPTCARHVRATERRCPFCNAALDSVAQLALAIALVAQAVGCASAAGDRPQAPVAATRPASGRPAEPRPGPGGSGTPTASPPPELRRVRSATIYGAPDPHPVEPVAFGHRSEKIAGSLAIAVETLQEVLKQSDLGVELRGCGEAYPASEVLALARRRERVASIALAASGIPPDQISSANDDQHRSCVAGDRGVRLRVVVRAPNEQTRRGLPLAEFSPHSVELSHEAQLTIDAVSEILKPGAAGVVLTGHSDATEGQGAALLAKERAERVRAALVKGGVAAERITVEAGLPEAAAPPSATNAARAANRRVDVAFASGLAGTRTGR